MTTPPTLITDRIQGWRNAMRMAAHVQDLTVTFTGVPEDMTFTLVNPDGHRHINLKIHNGDVHLLPSPDINLSIDRMIAICKTVAEAHQVWASEYPETTP